ncbi:MAG: hypothetical protein NMNS01_21680 [Nitrosomonas sp.]|nr:MAG: hypothetical protein NMNS01_21680 [Nitrosomonas sp.]
MKKLTKTQLAQELGISRVMLYKCIHKGCPTDSVEAAKQWRRNNLDIMQTKEWRIDRNPGVKRVRPDYSYEELTEMVKAGYDELAAKVAKG